MRDAVDPPLTLHLNVRDEELRDRLAALLTGVPGLRLAAEDETADLTLNAEEPHAIDATALTPREREVLLMLSEGASNREIARRLGISVHTAKFHVGSILDKLDATGRTDAVAQAARIGVIQL